jgi:hypothetical protein
VSKPTFNLLECRWLPVATGSPTRPLAQMSLREVFARAHEVRGLDTPSPLLTAALYRVLLAILHRAQAARQGRLNLHALDAYYSRWYQRFDLFDADFPFYQCPALAAFPKAQKAPTQLLPWRASDRHRPLLHDQSTPATRLSFAGAARGLILMQSYATGGLVSWDHPAHQSARAAPLVNVGVWQVVGATLLETLLANLPPDPVDPRDAPAWERGPAEEPEERLPTGLCDWYTWQSRRLLLLPAADREQVAGVIMMKGTQPPPGSNPWEIDAQVARDANGPVSPEASSPALCLDAVLATLSALAWQPTGQAVALDVTWVVTQQAKYEGWSQQRVRVPAALLAARTVWQPVLAAAVRLAHTLEPLVSGAPLVTASGPLESPLRRLIRVAPQRENERHAAPQRYWAELDQQCRAWLEALGQGLFAPTEALEDWRARVADTARHTFWGSLVQIPNAPRRAEECEQLSTYFESCLLAMQEQEERNERP